jgi:hypothetical protein
MKKALRFAFVVLFIGLCSVPLLGLLFGYKNVNVEKRALAEPPVLFDEKGFNDSFPEDAEDFLSDHYAFKPQLVTADAMLRGSLFGESVSEKVIVGGDGWLYFSSTLQDYLATDTLSENQIDRIVRTLEIQEEALGQRGVDFIFVVAPNKASVYPGHMPALFTPTGNENNYDKLYDRLGSSELTALDLRSVLRANSFKVSPEESLYLKLDSHWNNKGALLAYQTITREITDRIRELDLTDYLDLAVERREIVNGDLSLMLYPAANRKDIQYFYDLPENYSSARPIRSMEDILIETSCESGRGELLMFRDSFANALIPFFSDAFAHATYSRAIPYDYRLLNDETDVVVFEIVERNIINILDSAPIINSYTVAEITGARLDTIELKVRAEEQTDGILRLYGTAIPKGYDPEGYYETYIRIDGADRSDTFVTFPILETEMVEQAEEDDVADLKENVAFSAQLDLSDLPAGNYEISIIVKGENETLIAPYLSIQRP